MVIESFNQLFNGFVSTLTMVNLLACFIGVLIGTIVGVLPGLGPTATMALMLPFTMKYGPTVGLDHDDGSLVRRHVRRLDDVDPGQHPRRGRQRRDLPRRLSDGQKGQGRGRPDAGGRRFLLRRNGRHSGAAVICPPPWGGSAFLWSARIPLLHDPRLHLLFQSFRGAARPFPTHDGPGTVHQYHRH